ncbi:MAG: DUF2892 domain-containing protein [Nitrospiraceae bacterium]|nr:DUF2892 domain-containing protein [Nitrospiraceae bacterium]
MYLIKVDSWYLERILYLAAGIIVLLSLALSVLFSPYWLMLTAFVGINLVIFAATGFCMMANILLKVAPTIEARLRR